MEELTAAGALVATEVIKSLAKDMASFVKEKVSTYFTDTTNKELVDSEWAYADYLTKVYDTYSKSKTILYKDEKRELSSFFEPPLLRKKVTRQEKDVLIPSDNIEGIFNRSDHSKVLLTGIGGMGKTILLKHLCVNAIENGYKIPIFISLRWFNDIDIEENPLEKLIYDRLKINGFALDYQYFLYSLEGSKYVFLLDAYDEISSEKRSIITHKISDFTTQYAGNSFIMTSRPVEQIYCWDEYRILELCPMKKGQVENLIQKLDFDETTKEKFINELKQGFYEKYERFASIPLTLSVLFITYVENTTIPETLQEFYEMAFDTLLYRHDQMKEGYERVLKSKLNHHEFREIFIRFCFVTYFRDAYSFSEVRLLEYLSDASNGSSIPVDVNYYRDDLVDVTCMLVREGQEYVFLHRSFQEYFAAYYVSQIADEKQREFCISFTKYCSEEKYSSPNWVWANYDNTKIKDFMTVLNMIEPKRFDYIVLLPIMKKIHDAFCACDGDLITTTSQFLRIGCEKWELGQEKRYITFFNFSNGEIENRLNYGEFIVWSYFVSSWKEYTKVKNSTEIYEYIKENIVRANKELMLYAFDFREWIEIHALFFRDIELQSPFGDIVKIVMLIKAALLKYENLVSSNQYQMAFEDMLLKL